MICPYSKEEIHCAKFGPYTVPPGPCCKCSVPNPIKAKYFHIPELDDGERYIRPLNLEELENMEKTGFKLFGETFRDTLAYVQIQAKKKKVREG